MDLRQLRYFLAIVEQGSFSRAAQMLNVAQPALSLHVRNMEAELGTPLLFRSPQGVVATEAGQILLRNARIIIDQFAIAQHEIKGHQAEPIGDVRLGLPGTISQILAVPLIVEARRRYPKVRLRIAEAMSGFVLEWIREARIDLAVLYGAAPDRTLASVPLLTEDLWLLGPATPMTGVKAPASPTCAYQRVAKLPLILPSVHHGLRALVEKEATSHGIALNIAIEADSYANIKELVGAGLGYSILPFHSIAHEVAAGRLKAWRVVSPGLRRTVHLVQPTARPLTHAAARIEALCRATLLDLAATGRWQGARVLK